SRTPPPLISTLFPYTTLFRSPVMTHTTKNARRNSLRQREQANTQHKIPSITAMPSAPGGVVTLKDVVRQYGRCIFLVVRIRPNQDRKSTRLNSSHLGISYAVF